MKNISRHTVVGRRHVCIDDKWQEVESDQGRAAAQEHMAATNTETLTVFWNIDDLMYLEPVGIVRRGWEGIGDLGV